MKTVAELYPTKKSHRATSALTDNKRRQFYQSLTKKSVLVGFSWILSPEPDCSIEKTLEDFIFSSEYEKSSDKKQALLNFSRLTTRTSAPRAVNRKKRPGATVRVKVRMSALTVSIKTLK